MRALQLLGPSTGGIRVHVATLSEHLAASGIAAPVVGPPDVMAGLCPQAGTVDVPDGLSPRALVRARRQLRSWREGSALVHAHGLKAAWVAVRGHPDRPLVVTVHNVVLDGPSGRSAALRRRLEREVLSRADRVIAPTAAIADGLTGVRPDRIRIVVPASPVPVVRRSRAEIRALAGVGDDTPLVVCVARLHRQKDLPTLWQAWRRVHDEVGSARLAVVGEGPDRADLERAADREGIRSTVRLVGFDDHAVDWMAASDVVVLSSIWEAIPLVVTEAMQLGRPVVSTDVGLAGELLGDATTGSVGPVGDAGALADGMIRFLTDPDAAAAAGREAQARSVARFDPAVLSAAVADVYRELVDDPAVTP